MAQDKPQGLQRKLLAVLGEIGRLPKNGLNTHFNYKFVSESDVTEGIRALLVQHEIGFSVEMTQLTREGKKVTIEFLFRFTDIETGETATSRWFSEADDSQDKGINKAATAAVKYFLLKTFLIPTGDPNDDSDYAAPPAPPARQQRRQPAAPPASPPSGANAAPAIEKPATPKNPPSAPPAAKAVGWRQNVGDVYKVILPLYDNVSAHMNNSLAMLQKQGDINDGMTAEQVIAAVKRHKTPPIAF